MPGSEPARRHAPPAERRAQILEAALRCFGEKGYHGATMDDVVRASGLSKGSLYWHFRGKEDLLLALVDDFADEVLAELGAIGRGEAPILEGLRQLGAGALERLDETLPLMRAWLEFLAHPRARRKLAEVYARARVATSDLLRLGVERGELRPLPVESAAAAFVAAGEGLGILAFCDPAFDARSHWDAAFDALAAGLAGRTT